MLCTEIVSGIKKKFCTQHVLPMFCKKKSLWQRFTCTECFVQMSNSVQLHYIVKIRFVCHLIIGKTLLCITKIKKVTGKSLSEALIFASTNPQYDDRLFIKLQVQYMKIPSSNLGRTCCVQKLFLTFRTIFVPVSYTHLRAHET